MTVPIHSLTDTWDDAGTTFTAIRMNVTDTASAAASRLLSLQIGGADRAYITKAGNAFLAGDIFLGGTTNYGVRFANNRSFLEAAGTAAFVTDGNSNSITPNGDFAWRITTALTASRDLRLRRDAPGILAQHNGANPQAYRIYNTFTDASNFERGFMRWAANVFEIGTAAAGTGTKRDIVLDGANRAAYSETPADIAAALVSHGLMAPE
jgi:hypothetical protein